MCFLAAKTIKYTGFIITMILSLGVLACAFLIGFNFNLTNFEFTDGSWNFLAITQICVISYLFATCVMGLFTFCLSYTCLIVLVSISN
jgi:hypothetical protein